MAFDMMNIDPKLLTMFGMMGQAGSGMLQGTDKEWIGNVGGVAANAAKNVQAAQAMQELREMVKQLNNPNVKGTTFTQKKPDGSSITWKADGEVTPLSDPSSYIGQIPQLLQQLNAGQSPSTVMPKVGELQQPLGDLVRPFVSSPVAASAAGPSPFGMALLSPQEQVGILEQQMKTAALPTEMAESRSRAAYNAMQARKIEQGLSERPITTMIDGQPVTLDPSVFAQYKGQEAARALEQQRIGIAQLGVELDRQRLNLLNDPTHPDYRYRQAQAEALERQKQALDEARTKLTGNLTKDIPLLLRIHPEAANTYIKSLRAQEETRKAKAIQDVWQTTYNAAMRRYTQEGRMSESEMQQAAIAEAQTMVDRLYDEEGNPRRTIGSGAAGGGPPPGKFTYWD